MIMEEKTETRMEEAQGVSKRFRADIAYRSLNKNGEELCGDKVEILHAADSHILILADGMGSGVKANILATMTSKILGTMFLRKIPLERCVETIAETLPVCQVRQIAYATFSILQIYDDGRAYLAEFDNPACIFIREGKQWEVPRSYRTVAGRKIGECHFQVQLGDAFVLVSDGAINAGAGDLLNFGWTWESVAAFVVREYAKTATALHLASELSGACNDLYQNRPGDDTTVAVLRIEKRKIVNLLTGPARDPEEDERMVQEFMANPEAVKCVCGGTSSTIVARVLEKKLEVSFACMDDEVPPTACLEGIDLVTEGVITLTKTLGLLERYAKEEEIEEDFFLELAKQNGASMLAELLIDRCTELNLFIGCASNEAYKNSDLPFELGIRQKLADKLMDVMKRLGKEVHVRYY